MYLMRKVAVRQKGMGLKIMKFHGILHMADAILNFGVPLEYNTGCVSGPVVQPAVETHARFITNDYLRMKHGRGRCNGIEMPP